MEHFSKSTLLSALQGKIKQTSNKIVSFWKKKKKKLLSAVSLFTWGHHSIFDLADFYARCPS